MTTTLRKRLHASVEHGLVFLGDLLPYGVVFLLTLMVGYGQGLEAAGFFSLTYVYVAIVTALVCGPNLLSLRRRMPGAKSPGAVVAAALGLRTIVIFAGAIIVTAVLQATGTQPGMIPLMALLFLGRLLETAVDGPATSLQYLRGARNYFLLRLVVFTIACVSTGLGVLTAGDAGLTWIVLCYVLGNGLGLLVALAAARHLLLPVSHLAAELRAQATEFGKFFMATALFLAASRLHPVFIGYFSGYEAAGQFAMVQNLFSSLALAASGVAGVFFWSRNRKGVSTERSVVPWRWLAGALPGGLALGVAGGTAMDFLFLRPLGSSADLRAAAWLLCLSTPLLLIQAILSNQLVLLRRDRDMLVLSAVSAAIGLVLMAAMVYGFGLLGAALSVGLSALLSSVLAIFVVRHNHE